MSAQFKRSLVFAVLVLAAGTSWLLRPSREPTDTVTRTPSSQRGYYMNDAVFRGLDGEGRIIYRMAARRIEGSEDRDRLDLSGVEIRYAQDLELPWRISARSARASANRDLLELTGVIIESTTDDPGTTARIEAEDMQLEPERQLASTRGPVRLVIGPSTINAVGLIADLRDEKFVLESDVNAHVSP